MLPFAKATYQALEAQMGISIYHQRNILRTLFNNREENDWLLRTAEPGYEKYMLDKADLEAYAEHTVPAFGYGEVAHCAQVNLPLLVDTFRSNLKDKNTLLEEPFDFQQLVITTKGVRYKGHSAPQIIFSEGHQAIRNPYFNYLPFGGAKGEVLIIKTEAVEFEKILKHRVFITPLGDQTYWIGAAYDWKYQDDLPTEAGRSFLINRLNDFLKVPYKIIEHRAAIRPTVKDRRPFLGQHPQFAPLYIFNGLGTKGASLGPFWANEMVKYLIDGKALDKAVDIARFEKYFIPE